MGKKRIIKKGGSGMDTGMVSRSLAKTLKKKIERGIIHIQATYNNTRMTLTEPTGNTVMSASSGSLGFKGAKKGTPFAASKVGEFLAEKAMGAGLKEARIVITGVGAGRESSIRALIAKGLVIDAIADATPVPFNGPKPPRPRRV